MFRHKKQWWCPLRATVSDLAPHQQRTGKRSSTINLLLPRSPAPNWPMKRNYRQDQNPGLERGECYFTNRRVVIETGIPLSISGNGISWCLLPASGVKRRAGYRPSPQKRHWRFIVLLRTSHFSWIPSSISFQYWLVRGLELEDKGGLSIKKTSTLNTFYKTPMSFFKLVTVFRYSLVAFRHEKW